MDISEEVLIEARQRTLPLIKAYLRNYSVDPALAEDLLSTAILGLLKRKKPLEIYYLRSYLFTASKHALYQMAKKERRYIILNIDELPNDLSDENRFYENLMQRISRETIIEKLLTNVTELEGKILVKIQLFEGVPSIRRITEMVLQDDSKLTAYRVKIAIVRLQTKINNLLKSER
jgi:DNA-directed RNA polymerase specialized sigma24 family protein